ncbi:MAG: phosphate signaling complex protein PhoU [Candidatus Omnitrophota bacterium]
MERHFDEELADLKKNILEMGSLVEAAIVKSIEALKQQSKSIANEVIANDKIIDEMELKIDEQCLDLLALRQPMAIDLRFVTMAMKINTDFERIADLAVDIAQRALELCDKPLVKPLIDIPKLTQVAISMVHDVLTAFVNNDPKFSASIILKDAEADMLRDTIQTELITGYMMKDASTVQRAVSLLLIARHLERICDHATNIAEDVIYMVKARVVKHHPENLKNKNVC